MAENGKYVDLSEVGAWLGVSTTLDPNHPDKTVIIESDRISICIKDAEEEIDTICRTTFKPEDKTIYVEVSKGTPFLRLPRCVSITEVKEIFLDEPDVVIDADDYVLRTVSGGRSDKEGFRLWAKVGGWEPGTYTIEGKFGYMETPGDIPPIVRRRALQEYRRSEYMADANIPASAEAAEAMFMTNYSKGDYGTLMKYRNRNARLVVGKRK